jgi:hypothetical protein
VVPAQAGLEGDGAAGREVDDGLVDERERPAVERPAQVVLERRPLGRRVGDPVLVRAVPALAGGLRGVHRGVGVPQQGVGVGRVARAGGGDADARADGDLPAGDRDGLGDRLDQAVGDALGVADAVQVVEEDRELVPAEAGDGVVGPQRRGEPAGDGDEQLVPGLVAVRVVDLLEAVEVDEEDGEGGRDALAARAGERVRDPVGEQRAVGQAGQRVVHRPVDEQAAGAREVVDHRVERGDGLAELGVAHGRHPDGEVPEGDPAAHVGQRGEGLGADAPPIEHAPWIGRRCGAFGTLGVPLDT